MSQSLFDLLLHFLPLSLILFSCFSNLFLEVEPSLSSSLTSDDSLFLFLAEFLAGYLLLSAMISSSSAAAAFNLGLPLYLIGLNVKVFLSITLC
jgi:hypothetical protein